MEKFTKGAWQLHKKAYCCVIAQDGTLICNAGQRDRSFDQEQLHIEQSANAALIAAAPEMYGMLSLLITNSIFNVDYPTIVDEIESLLAKARGE